MKCKECESCRKGFFVSKPEAYVCIGVPEPFIINDINVDCTEYSEINKATLKMVYPELPNAYVGDDGIYFLADYNYGIYKMLISKELFVEAYEKWIKDEHERN